MELEISGRVAVVTGASAGIGLAVAQELVANDVSIVIAARDVSRLRAAETALLEQRGARVASIAVDVSVPDAAELIVDKAISMFGTSIFSSTTRAEPMRAAS
jgi:3-oxoacyl-[acyl-carrier protein] reductase